ncbi:MAG: hypothetical protein KF788_09040 [Piscinibacter sp.]|nr:hypothetical protein [Piscinibacter sp.]
MQASSAESGPYTKVIANSKRVRWDIEHDVLRGRRFDLGKPFLPAGLSLAGELPFLRDADRRFFSQVQGRSYAYIFGLVERFISAKMLEVGREHGLGDQVALEALVRMTDEEIKHQALFRRLETLMSEDMPPGYAPAAEPNAVADAVLAKGTWAVLALTLHIELFTQSHYRASIAAEADICALWRDVFLFHWKEESQHAVLDELEFQRVDARLTTPQRDTAIGELIDLVGMVDQMLQAQAAADAAYFLRAAAGDFGAAQQQAIAATFLKAYRWQYIVSGVMQPRFQQVLFANMNLAQIGRVNEALAPLLAAVPSGPSRLLEPA